ncbi:MAG TPA: phospholipase A [Dokdonella sp.]|jgi:phospholipase A1/A2|nr:phospholipase A [Dokdonella sp.]HPW04219.1 phospholipase A [Dokdonella sp.]
MRCLAMSLLLVGLPATGVPVARAQTADAVLQTCVDEADPTARLACYDRAAGRHSQAPAKAPETRSGDVFPRHAAAEGDRCERPPPDSLLDSRWELYAQNEQQPLAPTFCIRAYQPVYLMPFYSSRPNRTPRSPNPDNSVSTPLDVDNGELKYQISLKTRLLNDIFGNNGDLWLGYTQISHWQILNSQQSRPFRETNYAPDANLMFSTNFPLWGWNARMLGVGLVHQSNGRSNPLSRSWNRATATLALERENWTVTLRPWWRVLEFGEDNNADISDYMGRGEMEIVHVRDDMQFALNLRHSLRGGDRSHGAVQFDWAIPLAPPLRMHVQLFNGYGESLIDYNHRAWYAGVGLSLIEWY